MPLLNVDTTTAIGSVLAAPEIVEQFMVGDHHPVWTVLMLSIIVVPKIVNPTVYALRDVAVAYLGRDAASVVDSDDAD
jgi:hypothetical protein